MKKSGVPIALYVGKDDLMVNLEDQRSIRDQSKDLLVEYKEVQGGHMQWFVNSDAKIYQNNILP